MLRKWNCQDCCSIGDGRERERAEKRERRQKRLIQYDSLVLEWGK